MKDDDVQDDVKDDEAAGDDAQGRRGSPSANR